MKLFKLKYILLLLVVIASTAACKKDYYKDGGVHTGKLNMTIYDFLKSRPFEFDTIVWILDKTGLADVVKNQNVTFLAPRDLNVVNYLKRKSGAKLDTINVETLRTAMSKYIIPNVKIWRDSIPLTPGGSWATSLNGYKIFFDTWRQSYNGVPNAGPIFIKVWDPHGYADASRRGKGKATWPETNYQYDPWVATDVITSNLEATNGVIHALSGSHTFDFPW